MLLSIVLPAFNEEHRIGVVLDQLIEYAAGCAHDLEVILVDDGSTDATVATAETYGDELPELRVVPLSENRGKGRAVATGMLEARGSYRAFFDADGATPIGEVEKLLAVAEATPRTVAIGSIRTAGSSVVRHQPLLRTVAGRIGNRIIRSAVLPGIADSQRGCKLFPAELADVVFSAQLTDGWVFDIEVLALCQKVGYEIVEVAVDWTHIEGGQVRPVDYFWTLREVMAVRRLLRRDAHELGAVGARAGATRSISPVQRRAVQH